MTDDARAQLRAAFDRTVEYIRTAMKPQSVAAACCETAYDRAHRSGLQHGLNAVIAEFTKAGCEYPASLVDPAGVTPSEAEQQIVDCGMLICPYEAKLKAAEQQIADLTRERDRLCLRVAFVKKEQTTEYEWGAAWRRRAEAAEQRLAVLEARNSVLEGRVTWTHKHLSECFHCQQRGVCEEVEDMLALAPSSPADKEQP